MPTNHFFICCVVLLNMSCVSLQAQQNMIADISQLSNEIELLKNQTQDNLRLIQSLKRDMIYLEMERDKLELNLKRNQEAITKKKKLTQSNSNEFYRLYKKHKQLEKDIYSIEKEIKILHYDIFLIEEELEVNRENARQLPKKENRLLSSIDDITKVRNYFDTLLLVNESNNILETPIIAEINLGKLNILSTSLYLDIFKLRKLISLDKNLYSSIKYLPDFSPIPPPKPSHHYFLKGVKKTKKDSLHSALLSVLTEEGYVERFYYKFEDGFAIMTQTERIDANSKKSVSHNRWSKSAYAYLSSNIGNFFYDFDFLDYFDNLLFPQKGRFRTFVFLVSTKSYPFSPPMKFDKEVEDLTKEGLTSAPESYGKEVNDKKLKCHVLVYEYSRGQYDRVGKFVEDTASCKEHLEKAGLMRHFKEYGWQ